jgi:hypothetical protein
MSGSGAVLVNVFTAFRHLLLRNRDSIWDLLLGSGNTFIHFKGGHTYLSMFCLTYISPDDKYHFISRRLPPPKKILK